MDLAVLSSFFSSFFSSFLFCTLFVHGSFFSDHEKCVPGSGDLRWDLLYELRHASLLLAVPSFVVPCFYTHGLVQELTFCPDPCFQSCMLLYRTVEVSPQAGSDTASALRNASSVKSTRDMPVPLRASLPASIGVLYSVPPTSYLSVFGVLFSQAMFLLLFLTVFSDRATWRHLLCRLHQCLPVAHGNTCCTSVWRDIPLLYKKKNK